MEQCLHANGGRPLQMMKAPFMQDVLPNMKGKTMHTREYTPRLPPNESIG